MEQRDDVFVTAGVSTDDNPHLAKSTRTFLAIESWIEAARAAGLAGSVDEARHVLQMARQRVLEHIGDEHPLHDRIAEIETLT